MRFLISAGEASGELYGAGLIAALKRLDPAAEFFGVGGEAMRRAGCDTVVDSRHLSVVGLTEVLSHLPRIYSEFRKLIREADKRKPDAAIVIDSPAFNFRVAKEMHARGVPVIYYVVPQLWAWREDRIKKFRWIKKALVIFPFEEKWYRERGVDAEFVGHPLAELPPPSITREEFAAKWKLDLQKQWVAILPGSRRVEVRRHLSGLVRSAFALGNANDYILPVAPALDREQMERRIEAYRIDGGAEDDPSVPHIRCVQDAPAALRHSRAAVVASGTATVQAALAGVPFVIVYRVVPLTWLIGRRMLRVPYVGMPNLIAGEKIVPELLQNDFTPANVATELSRLLPGGPARETMLQSLQRVRARLHEPGAEPAFERAAAAIMQALK